MAEEGSESVVSESSEILDELLHRVAKLEQILGGIEEKYAVVRGAEYQWDYVGGEVGRYSFLSRGGDHWRPPKEVFWRLARKENFDFTRSEGVFLVIYRRVAGDRGRGVWEVWDRVPKTVLPHVDALARKVADAERRRGAETDGGG